MIEIRGVYEVAVRVRDLERAERLCAPLEGKRESPAS